MSGKAVGSENTTMGRTRIISVHQAHELIQRLESRGFDPIWAQRIIINGDYAQRIVSFIKGGGHQETISQQRAREIMGGRFLGVREVAEHLGVTLQDDELKKIEVVPFKEVTLQKAKDAYLLFLGIIYEHGQELTINHLREMFPRGGEPRFDLYAEDKGSWFDLEIFARSTTPELKWYLIKTDILEESRSKGFDKQIQLLQTNEYLENAVVYVYAKILFFLARGISIFQNTFTRCDDVREERRERSHNHVAIGSHGAPYGSCGITVGYTYDGEEGCQLGVAPAIKPDA